ncbi:predicted protein [Sclerotinia sclerotiorum 1980 UF-70]|uniref:Uncharacterized protein n=2 Tax=Sclerotinia sclerotiorum (strain ATCC 18683 / 1980 / Ss-1) TaxID=665079 RepID=A7EPI1_SCLS1|nr:predicted protein [Sclerotinia sclerotiorum 1980 UF-70]APA10312.1 hypothetical protein sscle_06g050820 [Sclerotinia sclerotiorum 1980 UF-70]EDO04747.1 predicted protein [Sclerotinia sclerotiorum 1980 UF-70]
MAIILRLLCLFSACALITAAPVKVYTQRDLEYVRYPSTQSIEAISSKRDTEYVRNPLSDWDTALPASNGGPVEPVPQADLKH